MKETLTKFKVFIGPYDYRPGFIFSTILVFNLSNLRPYTFEYQYGPERIQFFLVGLLAYVIMGLPLYLALKLSQYIWGGQRRKLSLYLFDVLIASLITLLAQMAGQKYLIPRIGTVNFIHGGVFVGELVTRFIFGVTFVAISHNGLRTLSQKLELASSLNSQLNERYAKLVESDEEIRSHASQLLHDRIQAKLMLAGAKLTRISGVLSDEGKLGVLPVIKELEQIRSIDVREVSALLSPNLAGEGLAGSCENLCKEFEGSVDFDIDISPTVEYLGEELVLGVYRIIEQGVINSIKHGPATKISIQVFVSSSNRLVVELRDNGPGGEIKTSGTGSVIIDAWISILGGEKEIKSESGKGFTLRVTAPVKLGS
jgi:signal transduction histidine kinase